MLPDLIRSPTMRPLLLCLLLTTGCAARLAVPEALDPHPPLPVADETGFFGDDTLTFGAWQAQEVDRSWVSGHDSAFDFGLLSLGRSERKQTWTYRFLSGERAVWRASCGAGRTGKSRSLGNIGVFRSTQVMGCQFAPPADDAIRAVLSLELDDHGEGRGRFEQGPTTLEVRSNVKLKGALPLFEPAGYELWHGERAVGAVQVIGKPAVWIAPEVDGALREAVATASAALLVFRPLDEPGR